METPLMAKKKPGPKPDPQRVREAVTAIRSSDAWKAYVEELAEFDRATSVSELMDRAIVAYAKQLGFKKSPPKR
jgi:hypothetical protein